MANNDLYGKRADRRGGRTPKRGAHPDDGDSVLAAFEDALGGTADHGGLLAEWTQRYPVHAADLAFAASEFSAPSFQETRSDDVPDALVEKLVAGAVIPIYKPARGGRRTKAAPSEDRTRRAAAAPPEEHRPVESVPLEEQAARSGVSFPEDLAGLLGVSPAFVDRLRRFEIDPGTIPVPFAARMAEILRIPLAACVRMLRDAPSLNPAIGEGRRPPYGMWASFEGALRESGGGEHWLSESDRALPLSKWMGDGGAET